MGRGDGEMRILALEASTSNAKALLYSSEAGALRMRQHPYSKKTHVGLGRQDAKEVFDQLALLARQVLDGEKVDAISLSVTWHSLLLCDREGEPASPVYLWNDPEAEAACRRVREDSGLFDELYRRTGAIVNPCYPLYKLLWLREQGTSVEGTLVRGIGSYLLWRFTGAWAVMDSMASGTGLFGIAQKFWDEELLEWAGIRKEQLSGIVPYTKTFPLSEEMAEFLGLSPGTPILPAAADGGLDQIGADAMSPGIMTMSVGTSGSLRVSTLETPRFSKVPSTWCYLSPVGGWLSGIGTSGCCNCVEWIKEQIYGTKPYEEIEPTLRELSGGPLFMPFLFGERGPEWASKRRGGFYDLRGHHSGGDLYISVLEGVLFNLFQCYQALCGANGVPEKIKLSGGVLNSPFWRQMCADIMGHDLEVNANKNSSLVGAAKLGLMALGREELPEETGSREIISFRPERRQYYMERYERYLNYFELGV